MADTTGRAGVAALARPSGAFAMLALDQRESLRTMLRAGWGREPGQREIGQFKVDAARALTPHASAVLLDVETGLQAVRAAGAIAPGCGLIVAADRLTQVVGGPVESTDTDVAVLADDEIATVADGYKLLVIWRAGREAAARDETVRSFLAGCRQRGRPGIVEAIVRPEAGSSLSPGEHVSLVLEAAAELGALRPDIYKAEVPTLGAAGDAEITEASRRLTTALACPWVVLSNGTPADRFADAAVAACRGGASGFLAGRAIWQASLGAPDVAADLRAAAAERLRSLAARVDAVARPWMEA
jgi:sulfofructosephosphate aldolase